jgi:hypothetical protein
MPRRLFSFLLALLILWSAFATQEQTFAMSAEPAEFTVVVVAQLDQERHHNGSVDDHHLDDQPAQAHAEGAFDNYGLLPRECLVPACGIATAMLTHRVARPLPKPYLDAPQRPPQTPAVMV